MRIVLCGSMHFKDRIIELGDVLKDSGFDVLLPVECIENKPKKEASYAHL